MAVEIIQFESDVTDLGENRFIADSDSRVIRAQIDTYQIFKADILVPLGAFEENLSPDDEKKLVPQVLMAASDPDDKCLIFSLDHEVVNNMNATGNPPPELGEPFVTLSGTSMLHFMLDPNTGTAGTVFVSNTADE